MQLCVNSGKQMGLISVVEFSCAAAVKLSWVEANYGYVLRDYCTGSFEGKVQIIQAILDSSDLQPENMINCVSRAKRITYIEEGDDPNAFCVEIIPLNTTATKEHELEDAIQWNWASMNKIKEKVESCELKVIVVVAAKAELPLCCGNLV